MDNSKSTSSLYSQSTTFSLSLSISTSSSVTINECEIETEVKKKISCFKICKVYKSNFVIIVILCFFILLKIDNMENSDLNEIKEKIAQKTLEESKMNNLMESCSQSNKNVFALIKKVNSSNLCQAVFIARNSLITNSLCFSETFGHNINQSSNNSHIFYVERLKDRKNFDIKQLESIRNRICLIKIEDFIEQEEHVCFLGDSTDIFETSSYSKKISKVSFESSTVELWDFSIFNIENFYLDMNDYSRFVFVQMNETLFLDLFPILKRHDHFVHQNILTPAKKYLINKIDLSKHSSSIFFKLLRFILRIRISFLSFKYFQEEIEKKLSESNSFNFTTYNLTYSTKLTKPINFTDINTTTNSISSRKTTSLLGL